MQACFCAMVDGDLDLGESDAGGGVVDVGVRIGERECFGEGGAEVVVLGEGLFILTPF